MNDGHAWRDSNGNVWWDEVQLRPVEALMSETKVTLAPSYDWKKTLGAGLRRGGMALFGVVVAGLTMLAQDPNALKGVLENAKVSAALIPLITAGIAAWANWQKNRDKG